MTGLARLAGARGLDVRGLVRLDLAHGRAMDHCPGGRACAALQHLHSGMSIMTEPGLRR